MIRFIFLSQPQTHPPFISVGLVQLNMDGTKKYNDNGDEVVVYDQEDIMSMARAWTGLVQRHDRTLRGNAEKVSTS